MATPSAVEAVPAGPGRGRRLWNRFPYGLINLVVLVAIWQVISIVNGYVGMYNPKIIPSPAAIVAAAVELAKTGQLWRDVLVSSGRVLAGLAIATPVAIVAAILTSASRVVSKIIEPVVEVLRPIPTLALLPMFILWLGVGEASKVAFIAFSTFFLIFIPSVDAMRNVEPVLLQASGSLGLNRFQMYRHVILPSAGPAMLVGVRLAMGSAWFLVVGAEFIAANSGLGYLINFSRVWFRVSDMMVGAVAIGLLGLAANYALLTLERRLFGWRDQAS